MYLRFCRRIQGTLPRTNGSVYGTVPWMEQFHERIGSVNGAVLLNGTVLYNAHQKSTYIYLYLYICICAFVVEYTERFHERNGSLNGTVPWMEQFRINHTKSQPTYIYTNMYVNGTVLWMERFPERNGSVNGTVPWTERFREGNGSVNGTVPWTERFCLMHTKSLLNC